MDAIEMIKERRSVRVFKDEKVSRETMREIIEIARTDYKTSLKRDSVVSILVKKIKAGHKFQRTAPNTFALTE